MTAQKELLRAILQSYSRAFSQWIHHEENRRSPQLEIEFAQFDDEVASAQLLDEFAYAIYGLYRGLQTCCYWMPLRFKYAWFRFGVMRALAEKNLLDSVNWSRFATGLPRE